MSKARAVLLALLTLLVPAQVAAQGTSDVEAFAAYSAEWQADRDAIIEKFFAYKVEAQPDLKSTLEYEVTAALVDIETRNAAADVRACFATYDQLVDEFIATLLRYFEVAGENPALAEAQYQYLNVLYPLIGAQFEGTLLNCAEPAPVAPALPAA